MTLSSLFPDSLACYLHAISQVALLQADEEIDLAKQMERGNATAQQLAASASLHPAVQAALHADIQCAEAARDHLIRANLRLVVNIAKRYTGLGLSLADLIQEGNLGLMHAVEKFDYARGHKFSTYATWWIRQTIARAIANKGGAIRLPIHLHERIASLRRTIADLTQVLERDPSHAEIAEASRLSVETVTHILNALRTECSLDTPTHPERATTLADDLPNSDPLPEDIGMQRLLHADLEAAIAQLPKRERMIIRLRYGLWDGEYRTLAEVGRLLGMSRERARQLEGAALTQIRSQHGQVLREYLTA